MSRNTTGERNGAAADSEDTVHDRLKERIDALHEEGDRLTEQQTLIRLKTNWNPENKKEFHKALIEFIVGYSEDHPDLSLAETNVALWQELARLQSKMFEKQEATRTSKRPDDSNRDGYTGSQQQDESADARTQSTLDPAFM